MDRYIFHIDVNSAFLSWEATRRVQEGEDDLRLVPSIIGGDPGSRTSIVAAKSIPAKKYGIVTGEPVASAMKKCPGLIVAPSDFKLYIKCSKAFKAICQEYSPLMESFSIDEVFLDMSGMGRIYPDLEETAYVIKNRIRDELGFTVNVGIGKNKLCAKMASDFLKPDNVHTLYPEEIPAKMWPLPVGELFTCGRASARVLENAGIKTIGDLAKTDVEYLKVLIGDKGGEHLWRYANGIDDSEVTPEHEAAKSYSIDTTVEEDITDLETASRILKAQADIVASRLRADEARCRCVSVTWRTLDFKNHSHQKNLYNATDVTSEIYETALGLLKESWKGQPLRLLSTSLSNVDHGEDDFEQLSLFDDGSKEKMKKLDLALDSIRGRYGNSSVMRAGLMDDPASRSMGRKHKAQGEEKCMHQSE